MRSDDRVPLDQRSCMKRRWIISPSVSYTAVSLSVRRSVCQIALRQSVRPSHSRSIKSATPLVSLQQQSVRQTVRQSVSQSVSQSLTHSLTHSVSRSVSQSVSPSVCQSVSQSVIKSDSQSVSQSVSQTVSQSVSQSVR